MKKITSLLLSFCLIISPMANEAEREQSKSREKELSLGSQFLQELAVPFTTNARYIFGGAVASAGMVYVNKGRRRYDKRETFDDAKPLGEFGFVGELVGWGYLNALYTIGHFSYGYFAENKESLRASEHMFKASFYTLIMTATLKTFIHEKRPGYPEDRESFPSGHSSFSFAFASVVASRHGWAYGSIAYGAATYISVSRINDDWHYLHDVLFGMGIGAAYGWGLKYAFDEGLPYQIGLLPMIGGGAATVSWDY